MLLDLDWYVSGPNQKPIFLFTKNIKFINNYNIWWKCSSDWQRKGKTNNLRLTEKLGASDGSRSWSSACLQGSSQQQEQNWAQNSSCWQTAQSFLSKRVTLEKNIIRLLRLTVFQEKINVWTLRKTSWWKMFCLELQLVHNITLYNDIIRDVNKEEIKTGSIIKSLNYFFAIPQLWFYLLYICIIVYFKATQIVL